MRKIKRIGIYAANLALLAVSWAFYKFPHGDEYLVLFMVSLVFMVAPYVMAPRSMAWLLGMNGGFLVYYRVVGALNTIDVAVFLALFAASGSVNYLVRNLGRTFSNYYRSRRQCMEKEYNEVVAGLEAIDRRGRMVETELNRITRLYEVTKQLSPVLKLDELMDALFEFLEENFIFETAHLLTFAKEKFVKGVSKSVNEKGRAVAAHSIDYESVVDHVREREYKSFFMGMDEDGEIMDSMNVGTDTFMVFPLFVADRISAILAIEGAPRASYGRFKLLMPQIALEFRKVELYEQVQELSIADGLTKVYLRRYLMTRLEEEVDRARRLGLTFSVAMIDVDHFKNCNDRYGHLVGDAVLKKIAERLKISVREVDMIARYGGEEFCIVLPETTKDLALAVAERIRSTVEKKEVRAFDESVKVTVSVGVATFPADADQVNALIDRADNALYRAKRMGRNMVCAAS
ncbi:MAG: GGDEF domain-containing protein [Candidatus Omnitrophica bacterium]|nr:GGDEF domain-containing protein [Candidatus Omnitrophota bacterium]MDD4013277.1 GGDEF domain-containing protein [Candidatus Omnitrophota bacterium]